MFLQAELVGLFAALLVFAIVVVVLAKSIRVVPEFMRLVIFRLGRLIGIKGPGLVFLIPVIDQAFPVDLREQVIEVSKQTCITKDNAPVDIDLLIYLKVTDPEKVITQVQNFKQAAVGIATTTLRAVVGDIELDEVLAKREYINSVLRAKLDEVTARWGVKVTAVEIREITPPSTVQSAMVKQIAAERERRAMIAQADGERQAAISELRARSSPPSSRLRASAKPPSCGPGAGQGAGTTQRDCVEAGAKRHTAPVSRSVEGHGVVVIYEDRGPYGAPRLLADAG